jgi:hypothetical protein
VYSEGAQFESWPGHWLPKLNFFIVFLSLSKERLGHYLILQYDCFLSYPANPLHSCPIIIIVTHYLQGLELLAHSKPRVSGSGPSISSTVGLQCFPWGKSVIDVSPWKVIGLLMGESSGRVATLLHLDLHDNFLDYHPLNELSSLRPELHLPICITIRLLPSLVWDTDTASIYYRKWEGCPLHMLCHMCWILSNIIMLPHLLTSSPVTLGKGP